MKCCKGSGYGGESSEFAAQSSPGSLLVKRIERHGTEAEGTLDYTKLDYT